MSQRVKVDRRLVFQGDAAEGTNIDGDMWPTRMNSIDWFDQAALDTTNDYVLTVSGSSDAGAVSGGGVNGVTLTGGNVDDDISFLATPLIFDITQSPAVATRLKIADVSGSIAFFGFSDATTETTPAATIDAAGGTPTAAATDAVGFVCDADYGTSGLYLMSVKNGGSVQIVDTGIDWADNETRNLKVVIDTSGNATGYVDGAAVAYIASAVADVPLCAIFNYGTRANDGSNLFYARYLAKWQDVA